jgi:ABC-type Zn uptake system ZnuABC Zn-binding protein ZnuA
MRKTLYLTLLLALPLTAAGCGSDEPAGADGASVRVVATTAHVADFVREVGGERVAVDQILPVSADPHDYEPRPSDARALAGADVVIRSGGDLDAWLSDLVDAAGGDAEQVTLLDAVDGLDDDPHWWQDPRNVVRASDRIRAALSAADPDGSKQYDRQAGDYEQRVEQLDAAIAACMSRIPAQRRKLVTNHDAFAYFARRYDIDVLGSILPSLSTSAQPSAGDVRELVATIRREKVGTVFPESALSQRLEAAVARESGAEVGPALYADALGPKGSPGATYLQAMAHDAAAIADGLGGVRCEL